MELLDGSLEDYFEGILELPFQYITNAYDMLEQIAQGLKHLYDADFMIRDLTLDNILLIDVGSGHHIENFADYGGFARRQSDLAVDIQCFGSIACQNLARKKGQTKKSLKKILRSIGIQMI